MDLVSVLVNLAKQAEPAIILIQVIAGLIALLLFVGALTDIWAAGNANSQKFLAGNQRGSVAGAVAQLFFAIAFLAIADLQLVGITTRTLTGNYVSQRLMADSISYAPGTPGSDTTTVAIMAIVMLLQVIGLIAIMKGIYILNGKVKGTSQDGFGKGFCFLIGGLCCWNSVATAWIINNTIGFNLFGLFNLSG
jgi:intracellular multiplication protein IcmC